MNNFVLSILALQIFSNNPNFWCSDFLDGSDEISMREKAQAGLLKIVLKSLGVQLSEKDEEADQISVIIEVATVAALVLLLILVICWVISRVSRGLRVCCCPPSLAHPADVFEDILRRAQGFRSYSPRGQVRNFDYF